MATAVRLSIGLQGFGVDPRGWAERAQLGELCGDVGLAPPQFVLQHRTNWPAGWPVNGALFRIVERRVKQVCAAAGIELPDGSSMADSVDQRPLIGFGHSDGATQLAVLAVARPAWFSAVVCYAGVFHTFARAVQRIDHYPDRLPPALFLNNRGDSVVSPDNAVQFSEYWGADNAQIIEADQHRWHAELANPFIETWLRGLGIGVV